MAYKHSCDNIRAVKIDKDLHHKVKIIVAKKNDGTTMGDFINEAIKEYIIKHNFDK